MITALDAGATALPQNVKSRSSDVPKKQGLSSSPKLQRTTFTTSREMDFFSEKELVTQTGHPLEEWPFVVLKELVDNSLDACEEAGIQPVINIVADARGITISDNGPGLPEKTLAGALNFTVRASNREAYVSPCRGAQGNALKTLIPMPHILDPDHGRLIVETHGKRHSITCGAHPISQRVQFNVDVTELPISKNSDNGPDEKASFIGTSIRLQWSIAEDECDDDLLDWPFSGHASKFRLKFSEMADGFALFNPHATITLNWFGFELKWEATNPTWSKWLPSKPTSPHWYEVAHFERLIGAYLTHDQDQGSDRLVSDLLAEFDGLTGSANRAKVLEETDLKRVKLSALVTGDRLDTKRISLLLHAMKKHTRPVNPRRLGIIGEDHFRLRLLQMGVQPESFRYSKTLSDHGLPGVLEVAFGYLPGVIGGRKLFAGVNWSAAINHPFRKFGATRGSLDTLLANLRADQDNPVVFAIHLAHPRVEFTDRGKSALVMAGGAV